MNRTTATANRAGITMTAANRDRFPARFARKDARTLVLRMAYGPQSNRTNALTEAPAAFLAMSSERDFKAARQKVEATLPATFYDHARCHQILADFNRLRRVRDS